LTLTAIMVAAVGCGGSSSGGNGSYSGGSYSSSDSGDGSLSSDVHSVIHEDKQDARIKRAQKVESLLNISGFKSMPADNPAKQKVIQGLQPLTFTQLGHHGKIHWWFADPYLCNCVYVGDELAYLRYKQAKKERKQEKGEEADLVDQENMVDMPMDSEWDPVSAFGMP
jgi:hypothetical protein